MVRVIPPDGADWTIDADPIEGGLVGLTIGFDLAGERCRLTLGLDRSDARLLGRGLFRASGDATERTFTGGSGRAGDG